MKKGEENTLTQQQVKRMIDYLSEHTDYKVLTNDEYQLYLGLQLKAPPGMVVLAPKLQKVLD